MDPDYFEIEQLTAWFGYDESSAEKENVKQVVSAPPTPAPEAVEAAKEPTEQPSQW